MARSRYGRRSTTTKDMYGRKKIWKDEVDGNVKPEKVSHGIWMESHGILVNNIHNYVKTEDHNSLMILINTFGETIDVDSILDEKRKLAFNCLKKASRTEIVAACKKISADNNYSN
jgi:hypothetical protein